MSKKVHEIFFRSPYNHDSKEFSDKFVVVNDMPSLTVQSMTDDADLNKILAKYQVGGKMPVAPILPTYGDFSGINDFQSALNAVMEAQAGFMQLPADVRSRFANDPQQLLEFLDRPENIDEAIKLQLLNETAVANREEYWKKDKAAKHAALLEAAKAAGLKFQEEAAAAATPSKT